MPRSKWFVWCGICWALLIAIAALIVGSIALAKFNNNNNNGSNSLLAPAPPAPAFDHWAPSELYDGLFTTDENTVIVQERDGSLAASHVMRATAEDGEETAGMWFGDEETGAKVGGIALFRANEDGSPSLVLNLDSPVEAGAGGGGASCDRSPPVKIDSRPGECPRFFVGINKKDPECHLHVNETLCVVGDAEIGGDLTVFGEIFGANVTAVQCTSDAQCVDADPCTVDACVAGFCENLVPDGNCSADHQCKSNERCDTGVCACETICDSATCNTFPCEVRGCVDGVCTLFHRDVGCCAANAECDDDDTCTQNICDNSTNQCEFPLVLPPPGRFTSCSSDADCPAQGEFCNRTSCTCLLQSICIQFLCNSVPCEVRTCVGSTCVFLHRDAGCCVFDNECNDFNPCTDDRCLLSECRFTPIVGPPGGTQTCAFDGNCGPNEICLSDCTCEPFVPSLGECLENDECDDNCPCTLDLCNKQCGCDNVALPGCCKNDAFCADSDPCHVNATCNVTTGLCSFAVLDADLDDVPCDVDCNDSDPSVGVAMKWFRDADGDGDGNLAVTTVKCAQPNGFVATGTDCDDSDPLVFAGSMVCNITDLQNMQKLLPPADERDEFEAFGGSVSIHADTIVVGAVGDQEVVTGNARVFIRVFDNVWTEQQRLAPNAFNTSFGTSVSIFANITVVGAIEGGNGSRGLAFVYERSAGSWTLADTLSGDPTSSSSFGVDVSIQEERIGVGDNFDDTLGSLAGAAYVFDRNQTTSLWSGTSQKLTAALGESFDRFGGSLVLDAADGNTLAIGAVGGNNVTGQVHIFRFNGTAFVESGTDTVPLVASDAVAFDGFGSDVDLDTGVLVVGTPFATVNGIIAAGAAYVFLDNGTFFVEAQKLVPPEMAINDFCGISVAVSGDTIVVGCLLADALFPNTGVIHVYKLIEGRYRWIGKMFPFDTPDNQRLGTSVDVHGNSIVGGAPTADIIENTDGAAYVSTCTPIRTC